MIINENEINISSGNESKRDSKIIEQNLIDKQAKYQIKITQQLR